MTPHRLSLTVILVGCTHASADVPWRSVRAADLRAVFVDHEVADGVHYAYQFRGDGTFAGFNMGKEIRGTWHPVGNRFCWIQRKSIAVEECFAVQRRGDEIRFLRDGYETFSGNLSEINAQPPTGKLR